MPKYVVTASEVTFYRATVVGFTKEQIAQAFEEDDAMLTLGLEEYDGEALQIVNVVELAS